MPGAPPPDADAAGERLVHDTAPFPAPAPGTPAAAGGRRLGRNLPVAIASGVGLAGVFLGTLAWHPLAFLTFFGVLVVIALLELDVALRTRDVRMVVPVAVVAGLLVLYGAYVVGPAAQGAGMALAVVGGLTAKLFDREVRRDGPAGRGVTVGAGATCLAVAWVPLLASFAGLLLAREHGVRLLIATVALSVANDIGAFAFGSWLGRHRLAPAISPAKSWEGFAGGLATALVVAGLVIVRLVPDVDVVAALALGAAVCVAATLGDLAESMIKRDLGIKDFGRIVPGHGGIMDRADAVIFALPAAHFLLAALGR